MILDKIIDAKLIEVQNCKINTPLESIIEKLDTAPPTLDFAEAIKSKPGKIAIIAEIKKASPSKGLIRPDFDPLNIADIYEKNGAAAISVLTDEQFFMGSLEYLRMVKNNVRIPVLRKDFIIDEYQIFEARLAGADAILLIAAVLSVEQLMDFQNTAHKLQMKCLVEIHDEEEMEKVLASDAKIIGINNRNLQTFDVSLDATKHLAPMIGKDRIIVSESGIWNRDDIRALADVGINAVLVGESLMREDDIAAKLRELTT